MRLRCVTAAAISALLMAVAVFLGNIGHTEYKSQIRKRKVAKAEKIALANTNTDTSEAKDVQLV